MKMKLLNPGHKNLTKLLLYNYTLTVIPFNQVVLGSNPIRPTIFPYLDGLEASSLLEYVLFPAY